MSLIFCLLREEPIPEWHEERAHLAVNDDNGRPFITGCDCLLGRDHYESEEVPA